MKVPALKDGAGWDAVLAMALVCDQGGQLVEFIASYRRRGLGPRYRVKCDNRVVSESSRVGNILRRVQMHPTVPRCHAFLAAVGRITGQTGVAHVPAPE